MQDQTLAPYIQYFERLIKDHYNAELKLFADGANIQTGESVKWRYPDGKEVIMSNFASAQNVLRALVSLSVVTEDPKWKQLAVTVTENFFDHYVDDKSGLFYWGGHRFINQETGEIEGPASKERVHELKHHFPFYELLHQVNPEKTEKFLYGFWAAHILDWQKLDLSRHGDYAKVPPTNLFSLYQPAPVIDPKHLPKLPETIGLTFVNASTDLIYAASFYTQYQGDIYAQMWAKHLYKQFVLARNPQTGMPVYQFSSPLQRQPIPEDDTLTYSWFGDRARRQFGPEFGDIALEANVLFRDAWPIVVDNPLAILACASKHQDEEMIEWVVTGLKSYFKHAWDAHENQIIPMWNNGVDMTGYAFKRDGYYGKKGTVLTRQNADPGYLLPLIRASIASQDIEIRQIMATMLARFELGLISPESLLLSEVNTNTSLGNSYLLFAILDLYAYTKQPSALQLAQQIAQNLYQKTYHQGYFVPSKDHQFARFDDPCVFALIAFEAAKLGRYADIPIHISNGGYLHGEVKQENGKIETVYDRDIIYGVIQNKRDECGI